MDAYRHCIQIAQTHYENFPVLSWALPSRLRPHVAAVYAFARAADDDADEPPQPPLFKGGSELPPPLTKGGLGGVQALTAKRERIETGRFDGDPVFEALGDTMRRFDLPPDPFLDLLSAFLQDTVKSRYESFNDVLDYCARSANPVGRIILMLFGYRDAERFALSDRICTALQLINFWQDIRADYCRRDRIYIPMDDLRNFGVQESELAGGEVRQDYKELIEFQVRRTDALMREGCPLISKLPFRLKLPIALFAAGGSTILRRIRPDSPRPTLNDWDCRLLLPFRFLHILAHA